MSAPASWRIRQRSRILGLSRFGPDVNSGWCPRPEKQRADAGNDEQAQAGGRAERHQQEQHRLVAGVVHRRAEPDDAGGTGNAKRPRHPIADEDHRQGARHAEQDVRLRHRSRQGLVVGRGR
jgi:hypothetical protein